MIVSTPAVLKNQLNGDIADKECISDEILVKEEIVIKGLMWPRKFSLVHEDSPLFNTYEKYGYPVYCGKYWTEECILAALQHGPTN